MACSLVFSVVRSATRQHGDAVAGFLKLMIGILPKVGISTELSVRQWFFKSGILVVVC